jgi:hypothetical protein
VQLLPPQDLSPLLALPRLFYLLVCEDVWDLSRLPEGWIVRQIRSRESSARVLEPANTFSRPICFAYTTMELFRCAKSPVAYRKDSAEWRWTTPWAGRWWGREW